MVCAEDRSVGDGNVCNVPVVADLVKTFLLVAPKSTVFKGMILIFCVGEPSFRMLKTHHLGGDRAGALVKDCEARLVMHQTRDCQPLLLTYRIHHFQYNIRHFNYKMYLK